jgi:hypothetical protein
MGAFACEFLQFSTIKWTAANDLLNGKEEDKTIMLQTTNKQTTITMKTIILTLAIIAVATFGIHAAETKTYQVTGPVLEVTATTITVQKGNDKWQMTCDAATAGKAKVGDKVTIQYEMVAKAVEVKAPKK